MDQKPLSKQTIIIGALSGILIVGVAAFFYTQYKNQTQEITKPSVAQAPNAIKTPDHETAMKDLFGVTDPSGEVKTGDEALSSFWFEQSFKEGTDDIHVIFFKTQSIDEEGEPYQSHAQGVDVGAITYKQIANQWQIISKQTKFGEAGSWGDVPETTTEIMQLSPNVLVLMVDSSYSGQGYVDEGEMLFAFSKNTWRDIGYVQTGGDNSGDCDDESAGLEGLGACWSYKGKISTVAGKNPDYPDLLVTRTGTESSTERGEVITAKNVSYVFNGEKYINPADAETQPPLTNIDQTQETNNQPLQKQQAKQELDEANKRLNSVWNATSKKIRTALLPEQRQWLKQRETDCSLKASTEQPSDKALQYPIKLQCMARLSHKNVIDI
ncbi:MAG: lysozyme inhibitor LprI family protein [Methylococcales bacterium]